MHLKYFFTRKLLFVKEADAVALFPGGFGTQDECFEVMTLVQTGKSQIFPIVMVDEPGGDYWVRWRNYITEVLLPRGLISPADLALFKVTDSLDEAVNEVMGFYRVYHSMRYVGPDLVLRLQQGAAAVAAGAHPHGVRRHRQSRHVRGERPAAGRGQRGRDGRPGRGCASASTGIAWDGCGC